MASKHKSISNEDYHKYFTLDELTKSEDKRCKRFFDEHGFIIINCRSALEPLLEKLRREIADLAKLLSPTLDPFDPSQIPSLNKLNFYKCLPLLKTVVQIINHSLLFTVASNLGHRFPCATKVSHCRVDSAFEPDHPFRMHQDAPYLIGSSNMLTIWIPLDEVSEQNGTLSLIPRSHLQGVRAIRPAGNTSAPISSKGILFDDTISEVEMDNRINISMSGGDMLVMSPYLLHASAYPTSAKGSTVRYTVISRISDLGDAKFLENGLPFGDSVSIFEDLESRCTHLLNYSNVRIGNVLNGAP